MEAVVGPRRTVNEVRFPGVLGKRTKNMNAFSNTFKTWTLMAALGGILILVGRLLGGTSGMVLALLLAVGMNAFVYWKSDSLALRTNGARELGLGEQPRLRAIVTEIAAKAGIPMPR